MNAILITATVLCCSPILCVADSAASAPRGLIVQLGGVCPKPGPGRVIHYLLNSESAVNQARTAQRNEPSVTVSPLAGKRLPHAENTVRHLKCEYPNAITNEEILRVLAPLGKAQIKTSGGYETLEKPWPDDIGEWTHWMCDAGSNPVAADQRVGPPRRMLWTATPRRARAHEKSPSLTGMVSARGRVFYINDEGPVSVGGRLPDKWFLVARDGFSGALLWKIPIDDWGWKSWSPNEPMNLRWGNPRYIHRRLVAAGDYVYVTLGYSAPVSVIDAKTGTIVKTLAGTENTCEIIYYNGKLILSMAKDSKRSTNANPPLSIVVLEPQSGEVFWRSQPMASLGDLSERGKKNVLKQGHIMIAVGNDIVAAVTTDEIVAFDLASGNIRWRANRPEKPEGAADQHFGSFNLGSLVVNRGRVYFGQPLKSGKLGNMAQMTLICLDATSGNELWRREATDFTYTSALNVYAIRDTLLVHGEELRNKPTLEILEAATGNTLKECDISGVHHKHHHRCYRNKATDKYILEGKEGVEFVSTETGEITLNRWVRGTCLYGVMPANGLLYATPAACSCNQMNRLDGFAALAPATEAATPEPATRFIEGEAFGYVGKELPADAWPQYRNNHLRSGAVSFTPKSPKTWDVKVGRRLTAPVCDGRKLYLGADKEVVAVDADTGSIVWRAHGSIDSPPTLHNGLVIFGTRLGWVHCVRATDGKLVWKFRAAPEERYILDDNRLESVWPVHGSVLLHQGKLFVTAGRSSFLDGGIHIYSLAPETGKVIKESILHTEQTVQYDYYEGVNNDILVTDGTSIYLKHMRIDVQTLAVTRQAWWSFSGPDGRNRSSTQETFSIPAENTRKPALLMASGFLDDELFGRASAQLDGSEFCNRISFDDTFAFGVRHSNGDGHEQFRIPGKDGFPAVCFDRKSIKKASKFGEEVNKNTGVGPATHRQVWRLDSLIRPTAILLTGNYFYVAGGPDRIDEQDPLRSVEWRDGGLVHVLDRQDGKTVAEITLSAPPVHEGLIATRNGLYVVLKDGRIQSLEQP
jgi:outer membrane protein assembly factor BamB